MKHFSRALTLAVGLLTATFSGSAGALEFSFTYDGRSYGYASYVDAAHYDAGWWYGLPEGGYFEAYHNTDRDDWDYSIQYYASTPAPNLSSSWVDFGDGVQHSLASLGVVAGVGTPDYYSSGWHWSGPYLQWASPSLVQSVHLTSAPPVPEPGVYAMLLASLGLIGVVARRRRSA
ncbi:MAG: PEP-CTERM sorting domain-containing protein [Zoogloeaceae bacterium]|jgi:hypothetical protein|nr:PEP-CTERM sorting domain-containing protein [Zoogloeaceae bacterium]